MCRRPYLSARALALAFVFVVAMEFLPADSHDPVRHNQLTDSIDEVGMASDHPSGRYHRDGDQNDLHDPDWQMDITLNPCKHNYTELDRMRWICERRISGFGSEFTGPKLQDPKFSDLTSIEDFEFETIREQCLKGDLTNAMLKMPFLLPFHVKPQEFFITQDNAPDYTKCHYRYKDHFPTIYETLEKSLKEIGNHGRLGSCAIVGSSGSLLQRSYGGEIELHDAIWRFNLAPAGKAFQRHVGRRTDFRVLNAKTTRLYGLDGHASPGSKHTEKLFYEEGSTLVMARIQPSALADYVPVIRKGIKKSGNNVRLTMNDQRFLNFANYILNNFRACHALGYDGDDIDARMKEDFIDNWKTTTSGMMVVLSALHMCDHVSVYGMGEPAKSGHFFHYYAYNFSHPYGVENTAKHNFDIETELLTQMAKAGLIRHCTTENCSGRSIRGRVGVQRDAVAWHASGKLQFEADLK